MSTAWLHPRLGTVTGEVRPPQGYLAALCDVARGLDADPAWHRWWRTSGLTACDLGIVAEGRLDHPHSSADIRRVADRLTANFTCVPPAEPVDLAGHAAAELHGMFRVIREALALPPLPPAPPPPTLPTEPPDVPVTTRPAPTRPTEPGPPHLPLAQIQEFFG